MEGLELMTVREVCEATRLSKSMVYKLLERDILHRVRLPGCSKVLISATEVRDYLEQGLQAATR